MNGIVSWIEHLPLSVIKGLYMNDLEFALSLLLLLLVMLWVQLGKKRMLKELLVVGVAFVLVMAFRSESAGWVRKKGPLVSFQGRLLALWEAPNLTDAPEVPLRVDYLMVRGRQTPDLRKISCFYQVDTLLIDGSVPKLWVEKWKKQAEETHTPYINIGDGCLLRDFSKK